jgi:serine protease Do
MSAESFIRSYTMPLTETHEVVVGWLRRNNFMITSQSMDQRQVQIGAEKGATRLQIYLNPHSPLATEIRVTPGETCRTDPVADLAQYIEAYLRAPGEEQSPNPPPLVEHSPGEASSDEIPKAVQEQLKTVVCIHAERERGDFQVSGFIIDSQGYIVCTAHDLILKQKIRVHFFDGTETGGHIVRMDAERDLALIRVDYAPPFAITMDRGRLIPKPGDALFAATCPNANRISVRIGLLDGPPRKVQGYPLWQVKMHIEHGSSGSPVFDAQGRLAAVVKGRYRGTDSIGFLIPFETLLRFLDRK